MLTAEIKIMGINTGTLVKGMTGFLVAIIGVVLIFQTLATSIPLIQTAGNTVNDTGAQFASFFAAGGIIELAYMGGVLLAVIGLVFGFAAIFGGKK